MLALWGRGQTRDYIDVHAALVSGAYSEAELLGLAARADNGFDHADFARMLEAAGDRPDSSFADYRLDQAEIEALRGLLVAWGRRLATPRKMVDRCVHVEAGSDWVYLDAGLPTGHLERFVIRARLPGQQVSSAAGHLLEGLAIGL